MIIVDVVLRGPRAIFQLFVWSIAEKTWAEISESSDSMKNLMERGDKM